MALCGNFKIKSNPETKFFSFWWDMVPATQTKKEEPSLNSISLVPDITGKEFSEWLNAFSGQDIIVINTTNASYPFSMAISSPGRMLFPPPEAVRKKYDTIFAEVFIEALNNHAGDYDKNTRLSIWKLFNTHGKGGELVCGAGKIVHGTCDAR